jgi:hypothetical protein
MEFFVWKLTFLQGKTSAFRVFKGTPFRVVGTILDSPIKLISSRSWVTEVFGPLLEKSLHTGVQVIGSHEIINQTDVFYEDSTGATIPFKNS